jgi:hypothetical protein
LDPTGMYKEDEAALVNCHRNSLKPDLTEPKKSKREKEKEKEIQK